MGDSNKSKIQLMTQDIQLFSNSKDTPIYSIPLQSTTTLNILFTKSDKLSSRESSSNELIEERLKNIKCQETPNNNSISSSTNKEKCSTNKTTSSVGTSCSTDIDSEQSILVEMGNEIGQESINNDDESDGEIDISSLAKGAKKNKSSFYYMAWDFPTNDSSHAEFRNVLVIKEPDIVLMFKINCQKEQTTCHKELWNLMVDIADNCVKRLRKMKDLTLPKISAQHLETLPLSDGQITKVHLDKVSGLLNENIALTDFAYRFQQDDVFIGTYVHKTLTAMRNYAIGKVGVIAILSKKSKYATIEAFSEQLCQHIAKNNPTSLGNISEKDIKRINKRGTVKIVHLQKDQLLLQNFASDPTIIVAEAARRSFVKIEDFLLFK